VCVSTLTRVSRSLRSSDLSKPTLIAPTSDSGVVATVEHKPDSDNNALLRAHVTNHDEHVSVWAADVFAASFANDEHDADHSSTATTIDSIRARTPRRVNVVHRPDCAQRRVCLGCSPQWRALQLAAAPDAIRAWGPNDLLRFDPLHGATASAELARANGDFLPFAIEPFECDLVHTLVAGPPDALCLWFFVPPEHGAKLRRLLAGASPLFGEPAAIVTLDALAAHGIDVQTAAQPLHHTVVVPPGWLSCRVYCGGGDDGALGAVGVQWRLLRATSLAAASRVAPSQRLYGGACSLSLVGLAVAAASEKLDFLEQMRVNASAASREDAQRDRRSALAVLKHILPALQSEVLEVVLQEAVGVSGLTALAYEPALASIAAGLPASLQLGMKVAGTAEKPRRSIDADATLDPYDACETCAVALFNGRRFCDTCSATLCTSCYGAFGHKHPMQLRRRVDTETLKRLARAVSVAVGVAGAGLEFVNKKDVLQIDATATLVGDTALADMPLSSFTLSVHPKRRRKLSVNSIRVSMANGSGAESMLVDRGALPQQYQQVQQHQQQQQQHQQQHHHHQQQQQQHQQQQQNSQQHQQAQSNVPSDDDNSGGNNNGSHKFNSNNNDDEEDDEDDRIDCICGRNDDRGFMLFCDRCRVWLHGKCVNITKKTVPEVFVCPRCLK
jgi:hypothetical protein